MPYLVTDVQVTPNPNALKFVLDRPVSPQPASFFNAESARDHPLAVKLFAVDGVTSVLLLGDFVTVNKGPNVRWNTLTPKVRKVMEEA